MLGALMAVLDITHRQRRAQRHPGQLRHAARPDRLGVDRLHDGQRRRHPDDGLAPAALRLPALLRRLDPDVHRGQRPVRRWPGTCPRWSSSACSRALGGGAIIPTSQSILFARYPRKEHGMAGALFGLGAVTGPLLGPTSAAISSRSPAGTGSSSSTCRSAWSPPGWRSPRSRSRASSPSARADRRRPGIALLAVGMASLQYVLEEGNRDGWFEDTRIVVLAVRRPSASSPSWCTSSRPSTRWWTSGCSRTQLQPPPPALNFLVGMALFAGSFLYSLFCGTVMHYTAMDIGMLFLRGSWIQLLIMPLVGRLVGKVDSRALIAFGTCGLRGLALDERAPHPARRHPRADRAHLRALAGARASSSCRSPWSRSPT